MASASIYKFFSVGFSNSRRTALTTNQVALVKHEKQIDREKLFISGAESLGKKSLRVFTDKY
jgi:hypothetical protein